VSAAARPAAPALSATDAGGGSWPTTVPVRLAWLVRLSAAADRPAR
jgi:hypothetical protein